MSENKILQPDFEPSSLWSFNLCSGLFKQLLTEKRYEEWIGDLEEVLYKMYQAQQSPKWRLHLETLGRTLPLLKSALILAGSEAESGDLETSDEAVDSRIDADYVDFFRVDEGNTVDVDAVSVR